LERLQQLRAQTKIYFRILVEMVSRFGEVTTW